MLINRSKLLDNLAAAKSIEDLRKLAELELAMPSSMDDLLAYIAEAVNVGYRSGYHDGLNQTRPLSVLQHVVITIPGASWNFFFDGTVPEVVTTLSKLPARVGPLRPETIKPPMNWVEDTR